VKKSNDEVLEEVQRTLMKRIRQRQLAFLEHVLQRQGLENFVMTGRMEERRATTGQVIRQITSNEERFRLC